MTSELTKAQKDVLVFLKTNPEAVVLFEKYVGTVMDGTRVSIKMNGIHIRRMSTKTFYGIINRLKTVHEVRVFGATVREFKLKDEQ